MASRGINIPEFSALSQFVDPMAQAGKFASAFSARKSAEESAALDRMFRDQQAKIQEEQWNKSFGLQEAANKRAETADKRAAEAISRSIAEEANKQKLFKSFMGLSSAIPFKDTVSSKQTNIAKEANILTGIMQGYNDNIEKAKKAGNTKLVNDLTQQKNNYAEIYGMQNALAAEERDLIKIDNPNYSADMKKALIESNAPYETKIALMENIYKHKEDKGKLSYDQLAQAAKLGVDVSNKSKEKILQEMASIAKNKKDTTKVGTGDIYKTHTTIKDVLKGDPNTSRWMAQYDNRITALAKKAYPEEKDINKAKLNYINKTLIPQIGVEKGEWFDPNFFDNEIKDAIEELED